MVFINLKENVNNEAVDRNVDTVIDKLKVSIAIYLEVGSSKF